MLLTLLAEQGASVDGRATTQRAKGQSPHNVYLKGTQWVPFPGLGVLTPCRPRPVPSLRSPASPCPWLSWPRIWTRRDLLYVGTYLTFPLGTLPR